MADRRVVGIGGRADVRGAGQPGCDARLVGQMPDIAQRAVHGGTQIDCLDRQFGHTGVGAGDRVAGDGDEDEEVDVNEDYEAESDDEPV